MLIFFMEGGTMVNNVILVGRLTKDPELSDTKSDKKRTIINLAVTRNYKNSNNEYETDFIRCVLWNNLAANTCDYCKCGDVVGIKGRLESRSYEEKKEKKYITEVIVEKITFLSSNKKEEM